MDIEIEWGTDIALIIQLLVSTILPLIVGLVTKRSTSSSVKALLLAALALVSSGLTELLTSINGEVAFDFGTWLIAAIGTFVVAVGTHFGLWKPTQATQRIQGVGNKDTA